MGDEGFVRYMSALLPRFVGALPAPDIERIVARLQRVHMASGEILYRQGDAGDCMHFVVTGRLEVWVTDKYGERRLVAYRSSGSCAGELALLTGDAFEWVDAGTFDTGNGVLLAYHGIGKRALRVPETV